MRNPIIYILLATVSIFMLSCNEDSLDPTFFFDLDTEFNIRPTHILSHSGQEYGISIAAIDPNICDDAMIVHQKSVVNGISVIKINDIINSDNCHSSDFDPSVVVDISELSVSNIALKLSIGDIVENSGNLVIDADGASLIMASSDGIRITDDRLLHLPNDAIWGGISAIGNHEEAAMSFMDALKDINTTDNWIDGYYGHFKVQNDQYDIFSQTPLTLHQTIAITTDQSWQEIESLASSYESDYPGLEIKLFNTQGEEF